MNRTSQFFLQSGIALILSLLLLFLLTLIGVASFGNASLQERMASNARTQTMAFEAAAAGAVGAIDFFEDNRELGADQLCGSSDHEGWADPTAWVDRGQVGVAVLSQRMYCLADVYSCEDDDADCGVRPPRSQLFVLSRGEVLSGEQVVATRDIEVRLAVGSTWAAGDGCGALCFPGCESGTLNFPTSNAFQVDGAGGPAITAGCQGFADDIRAGIRDNRIGNYIGGIAATDPGSPWDDPDAVEAFRANIAASALAAQLALECPVGPGGCYHGTGVTDNGNTTYGTVAAPQITYINGDASMGGNISGAGIMLVNGNLSWSGTPNFQGLLIVLGGTYTIGGGGHGGDQQGSVVILNAPGGSPAADYGEINFDVTGGGTAEFAFNCGALWAAQSLLDGEGQSMWSPECDTGPQNPYEAGPDELIIASWRENVGWREEFFGSE